MSVFLQPIYTQTVGSSGAASITFNNIPQTFTDLKVIISGRSARNTGSATDNLNVAFNSTPTVSTTILDSGSPYGSPRSFRTSYVFGELDSANDTANTFGSLEMYIPNYTSSNYKSSISDYIAENNSGTGDYLVSVGMRASLIQLSSGITSITFTTGTGSNFLQYSTFSLYGVLRQGV